MTKAIIKKSAIYVSVVSAFVLFVVIAAERAGHSQPKTDTATAATEVDVAQVLVRNVSDWQSYSGRLQAVDDVSVHALVPGTIENVYFRDGQIVKKGDPLFLIDPRPYAARLDQARARLDAAKASQGFAVSDYDRAKKLIADNAISKRDFDQKFNAEREAAANVKAAEAAVEDASVDLGYTHIDAPVDGRMSRAEFTVGNIVSAGTGSPALTTLVSVSPIYAAFDVDEQTYLNYLAKDAKRPVAVKLGLANESGYSRPGKVYFIDNQLSAASGTIRVRAIFDNADGVLLPGLYARIAVDGGVPHSAILVDERAISTDQAKKFVLVVDQNNHAQYREIKPGYAHDGYREVDSGLQAGEKIVVNGIQLIHPGDEVKVHEVPMTGEQGRTELSLAQ